MSKTIQQLQDELVEVFAFLDDWEDKYSVIIDYGKELAAFPENFRMEEFIVKGCQSRVWVVGELMEDGRILYHADSDAIITKGLVALVLSLFNQQKPSEIIHANLDFFDKIGLGTHLTPTRANGLLEMIKRVKGIAQTFEKS
jgi:cysteine desulfuration protein SufE